MRIPRIFTTAPLAPHSNIELDESASRHLCQVLRFRAGQGIRLFNGEGGEYDAEILRADHRRCEVKVGTWDAVERESPLRIHLGLGLSKGDRFDWALQKATELGVASITPLFTARAELRLDEARMAKKLTHWQRLIASSCEQSQRNRLPRLDEPCSWALWLERERAMPCYILHPDSGETSLDPALGPKEVCVAIGPEGGFTTGEVELAQTKSFVPLTLGPRVLRTETAPIAAISVLQWLWGDWRS